MKKLLLIAPLALVAMAGTAHIYNSAETNSFTHKTVEVSKAETVENEEFLVYFHLPEGWNTPNIWPWETDSGTNPYTPIGWPGLATFQVMLINLFSVIQMIMEQLFKLMVTK